MAGHLRGGQVIFLAPGSFGSYLVAGWLREAGHTADVALAEAIARNMAAGRIGMKTGQGFYDFRAIDC